MLNLNESVILEQTTRKISGWVTAFEENNKRFNCVVLLLWMRMNENGNSLNKNAVLKWFCFLFEFHCVDLFCYFIFKTLISKSIVIFALFKILTKSFSFSRSHCLCLTLCTLDTLIFFFTRFILTLLLKSSFTVAVEVYRSNSNNKLWNLLHDADVCVRECELMSMTKLMRYI